MRATRRHRFVVVLAAVVVMLGLAMPRAEATTQTLTMVVVTTYQGESGMYPPYQTYGGVALGGQLLGATVQLRTTQFFGPPHGCSGLRGDWSITTLTGTRLDGTLLWLSPCQTSLVQSYNFELAVTGGTGEFAGATGSGRFDAQYVLGYSGSWSMTVTT